MKKPSSRIREEIARLQDQLKVAETREAERIGRVALRAGIGEVEIEESDLHSMFEEIVGRFRGKGSNATGRKAVEPDGDASAYAAKVETGSAANGTGEA